MLQFYVNDAKHCCELIDQTWKGNDSSEACISTVCALVDRVVVDLLKILLNSTYTNQLKSGNHVHWVQQLKECFARVSWYRKVRDNMPVVDGFRIITHYEYSTTAYCSAVEKSIATVKSILQALCVEIGEDTNRDTQD